jgi:hypothetical protein
MKIRFQNQWSHTEVYVISEKDQSDLDYIIPYEFMYNEETDEYISDEMKALGECLENWNPGEFVRLYNKLDQDNWYCELY